MKFATVSKTLIMGLALLLASSAFAANKASLSLMSTANVNGTQLKPGDYTLQWDGAGPNVDVSIMQGKKVLAKVPAKLVDLGSVSANNAAIVNTGEKGNNALAGARFAGKKFGLEIGSSDNGVQAGSSK